MKQADYIRLTAQIAESRTGTQRNTERPAQRDNNGVKYAPRGLPYQAS